MVKVKKTTITSAEILTLSVTPKTLLPAPAAGSINNILGITIKKIFNTTIYLGDNTLVFDFNPNDGSFIFNDQNTLISAFNTNIPSQKSNVMQLTYSTTANFTIQTANPATNGDSDVDVFVIYEEKVIE